MLTKKHFMAVAEDYIDAEIKSSKEAMNGTMATQSEAQRIARNLREQLLRMIENAKDGIVFDN